MSTAASETTENSMTGPAVPTGIGAALAAYRDRVRAGDVGSLPAVFGFVVLALFFSLLRPETFPTPYNAANLLQQGAGVIFIAMGLVFILLLGEIDLGAGYTAGTSAAVMAVLMTLHGVPWPLAVLACLITGAIIGAVIGLLVARLGIPSFVVTLSTFLGLQGAMLAIIGEGGTIRINDPTILAIQNKNLPVTMGWILTLLAAATIIGLELFRYRQRTSAGLPTVPLSVVGLKVFGLVALLLGATWILSVERSVNPAVTSIKGIPYIVPFAAVFVILLTFVLQRTRFGRLVYATGGNAEAARRAGINVPNIRIACFVIGSMMAAVGGIVLASRENSVSPTTGGSTTLLLAVGAAVIGGTSLFGGKGRIIDAVIGGLVVAVLGNGIPLMTSKAWVNYVVTALVLLLAASVDALARRRAASSGR